MIRELSSKNDSRPHLTAWLVHLYTASGALWAFLALTRIYYDRYPDAFFWLFVTVFVDATDGLLARAAAVKERLPWFNGSRLDDIVDYLTYVFVPAFFVWHAVLVPDRWAIPIAAGILLSSAYGFSREDAKTDDHFFTGFPSYWNVVAFYLYVARWPQAVNAGILLLLTALVFVPIRYVYPSRTPVLQAPTLVLGVLWGVLMIAMLWQAPEVSRLIFWLSLLFPAYYVALSLALQARRRGI
ncbi:MAG: CDP-diacylglycerol O-phosphatidyltransferase [Acidimicrobiia bacterium]|nr:CDP-diacylglycerol O-phosphatidyltransferase [Acidimicrobiia bacterium]